MCMSLSSAKLDSMTMAVGPRIAFGLRYVYFLNWHTHECAAMFGNCR